MTQDITKSVIRILNQSGTTIGTGFMVAEQLAVTCAHVVKDAVSDIGCSISIQFYIDDQPQTARVLAEGWSPPDADDVAFIYVEYSLDSISTVILGSAVQCLGNQYGALGFAKLAGYDTRYATGTLGAIVPASHKQPVLQCQGEEIKKGMSGAPVLDLSADRVVGMVSEFKDDKDSQGIRFVWATTADTLVSYQPSLALIPTGIQIVPTTKPKKLHPGEWLQCGPNVEMIRTLATDPDNSKVLYAGVSSQLSGIAIYKSTDEGRSWKPTDKGLPNAAKKQVNHIIVCPHTGFVYAATVKGLFVSNSQGELWKEQHDRFSGMDVRYVGLSTHDPSWLACGTKERGGGGVFIGVGSGLGVAFSKPERSQVSPDPAAGDFHISADRGSSWSTLIGFDCINVIVVSPQDSSIIYLGTGNDGLHRSTNGGATWKKVTAFPESHVISLTVSPKDSNSVFIGSKNGLYTSLDSGATWRKVDEIGDHEVSAIIFLGEDMEHVLAGSARTGIFESLDGGINWQSSNQGLVYSFVSSLVSSSNGVIFAGLDGGGVSKREPENSEWLPCNNGFLAPTPGLGQLVLNSSLLYLGTSFGIYKSLNGGDSWKITRWFGNGEYVWSLAVERQVPKQSSSERSGLYLSTNAGQSWQSGRSIAVQSKIVFAGTETGTIYRSTNAGMTWQQVFQQNDINQTRSECQIWSIAVSPYDNNVVYAGTNRDGVQQSVDGGMTWLPLNEGLSELQVCCIFIDARGILYAGTGKSGVYVRTNETQSWQFAGEGLPEYRTFSFAQAQNDPDTMYVATQGGGVYKTTDGGRSWHAHNKGLNNLQVQAVAVLPRNNTRVYAGTMNGMYRSTDGGATWHTFNKGIGDKYRVNRLSISPNNPDLIYAAMAEGLFKILDTD